METSRVWICCASGASAAAADLGSGPQHDLPTIAVNDAWQLAHHACRLYAADWGWWSHHIQTVRAAFHGDLWTCSGRAAAEFGINRITCETRPGLSREKGTLRAGGQIGFSGAQAINMAYLEGARTILLVGYDMDGPQHFFGLHPPGLNRSSPWGAMIKELGRMAWDLSCERVRVLNCSPRSRIPYWPRMTLADAMASL